MTARPLTQAERDERAAAIKEIHGELERKFAALTTSDDWRQALEWASKFYHYSFGNTLWLMGQAMARESELTRVASYRMWQELGRQVRKGETSYRVLAPMRFKIEDTDKQTGARGERWIVKGFKPVPVFDLAQTDGDDVPNITPTLLTDGGAEALLDDVAELVRAQGFAFTREPIRSSANGYTDHLTKRVVVRNDVAMAQAIKTSVHELAHVMLHAPADVDYHANRERCEVEAESVAYVVLTHLGLVADDYSLPYVAGWSGGDVRTIKATAETVIKCARSIIDALESVKTGIAPVARAAELVAA